MDSKSKSILLALRDCEESGLTEEAISRELNIKLHDVRALMRIHAERDRVEVRREGETWPSESKSGDPRNMSVSAIKYYRLSDIGRRLLSY